MSGVQIAIFEHYQIHYVDHDYHMDFDIYEITGHGENPETHEWTVPLFGDNCEDGIAPKTAFWDGSIKWDGCSNWDFKTDECMAHFCGRGDAESIGRLMGKLYDLAATMSKWSPV